MPFEFFVGLRYLKAKRKQTFISIITIISVVGVMVGVMALVVVISVMNGFRADLMSKILGVNSHLLVLSHGGTFKNYEAIREKIKDVEGVAASTPFIFSQVMVNSTGRVSGAIFRGLDTRSAVHVTGIKGMIKKGELASLDRDQDGMPAIIIGTQLARQIGAQPGDTIVVVSPHGKLTPMGRVPNNQKYRVTGLFDSGFYEYDASHVYVSLETAQDFLGMDDWVTGLEIKVDNVYDSDRVGDLIDQRLGFPYWTKDWKMMNRSLFSALKIEKITMFIILSMIILVGALNIISTLVMVVMEKTRDIAILRAMGATTRNIMSIFMFQGVLVGVVGTVMGLFAGLALCQVIERYELKVFPDVYYISRLPVQVEALDVLFVALAALGISFLATLYPSWRAAKLNPVEALRYE